jgi:hypothetical protein
MNPSEGLGQIADQHVDIRPPASCEIRGDAKSGAAHEAKEDPVMRSHARRTLSPGVGPFQAQVGAGVDLPRVAVGRAHRPTSVA